MFIGLRFSNLFLRYVQCTLYYTVQSISFSFDEYDTSVLFWYYPNKCKHFGERKANRTSRMWIERFSIWRKVKWWWFDEWNAFRNSLIMKWSAQNDSETMRYCSPQELKEKKQKYWTSSLISMFSGNKELIKFGMWVNMDMK